MDWLNRMNRAMDYIEAHLCDELDYEQASKMACCSAYHFQHMFSFITGVPLSEYIRRRRLTLAAFELQNTSAKVIDLAYKYGYESPEAFSRAFSRLHGVAPIAARGKGTALKAYPRMAFHISIKGDTEMVYRIEEKDAFEVFGLELETNVIGGQCYKDIPAFWAQCESNGRCLALARARGLKPNQLLEAGVTYGHKPDGTMRYMIGCIKQTEAVPPQWAVLGVSKQTWAIFSVQWHSEKDNQTLHDTWQRIYTEWFPTAHYEHADCDCDMERYFGEDSLSYGVEIWIPVVKKG